MYVLFELGKDNLGVPMTLKMIYPYLENYQLLWNLMSVSTLIFAVLGYILIIGLVFYIWNKAFKKVTKSPFSIGVLPKIVRLFGVSAIALVLLVFVWKSSYFWGKFNVHKIAEPYLTLIYFDEAFNRQKDKGDENALEQKNYSSPKGNGKNVVLIIVDALRPDFFQAEEKLTPFVDSLLTKDDFVFHKNMFATASFSFNGISSILSSSKTLYDQNFFIHDVLKKQGYDINFILSGDMTNFWDLKGHMKTPSVDFYTDGYESFKYGRSESLNDDRKNILDQLEDLKPFQNTPTFFYFHMMSVHQVGDINEKYQRFKPSSIDLSASGFDSQLLMNDYKNRMIQRDDYIHQLYTTLKRKGYLENYVFVITADHGQSLGENGIYFHSKHINYESVKIPLIINSNYVSNTKTLASQLDIAPSILEALNLNIPKTWKGKSLSDTIPQTIFQTQGDKYAMIWQQDLKTYQLFYNRKTNEFNLFDFSMKVTSKSNDISNQWETKTLDSLQRVLKEAFQLD